MAILLHDWIDATEPYRARYRMHAADRQCRREQKQAEWSSLGEGMHDQLPFVLAALAGGKTVRALQPSVKVARGKSNVESIEKMDAAGIFPRGVQSGPLHARATIRAYFHLETNGGYRTSLGNSLMVYCEPMTTE